MFYFAKKTKKNSKDFKPIKAKTIQQAEEWLNAYLIVNERKSKSSSYTIITKDQFDEMVRAEKEKEKKDLEIDERALYVWREIVNKHSKKKTSPSLEDIKTYQLKEGVEKPYYAICYWDNDENGSFCNIEDLKQLYEDKAESDSDMGFGINIYDVRDINNIVELKVEAKVTVELFVERWDNGKYSLNKLEE